MVSSSYPYNQLKAQKDSIDTRAKASIQKAVVEEKNTRLLEDDLRQAKTTQSTNSKPLTIKFQEFMYGIRAVGVGYGVEITSAIAKDGSTSGTARELSSVAVPLIAAPGIKVITIELRGKAKNYEDLRTFLNFLLTQQMSIANINLSRDSFAATIEMYGV